MSDVTLFVALVCLLVQQTEAYYVCDENWKLNTSYCYQFHTTKLNWKNAQTKCQESAAHLPIIHDEETQHFIYENLDHTVNYWIGLNDQKEEGVYKWLDTDEPLDYTNWNPTEPNSGSAYYEDCVELLKSESVTNPYWNDVPCRLYLYYICQKDAKASPVISAPYDTTMDEGKPVGTRVPFTHTVTDKVTPADKLTYALAGTDAAKFAIDGSGAITLAEVLDYEAGKTSFSINLQVTNPIPLQETQVLTLNLIDVNDNSPICTPRVIYSKAITESDAAVYYVCDENWKLGTSYCYQFHKVGKSWQDGQAECEKVAAHLPIIHDEETQLFLNKNMDQSADYWMGLIDQITEGDFKWFDTDEPVDYKNWKRGEPNSATDDEDCTALMKSNSLTNPNWNDLPCNLPRYYICQKDAKASSDTSAPYDTTMDKVTSADKLTYSLAGKVAATLTCSDADGSSPNKNITLSIVNPPDEFAMSGNDVVTTASATDYESQTTHKLVIQAVDGGKPPNTGTATVFIVLTPLNEYSPSFTAGESATLPALSENTPVGTSIYQAVATDSDKGSHGDITYSIDSGNIPANSFVIDSNSGDIFVWSAFDYDTVPTDYNLTIKAEDGGGRSSTMWLYIPLKDENDIVPDFNPTVVNLSVDENVAASTDISPAVVAKDGDSGANSQVSYSIVGGDGASTFSINPTSGMISTTAAIDFESHTRYSLLVKAVDAGTPVQSSNCMVIITVNDLNDNPPVFTPDDITTSVSESASVGTSVITMVATDDDSTTNNNNDITYSLTSAFFSIDSSTGEITTTALLDRESNPSHHLTVKAYDRGGSTGSLTGTLTVTVNLIDVNDNPPVIMGGAYDLDISETLSPGSVVVTITASDADNGDNARLSYSIVKGATDNDLAIETHSGVIQVANLLNRERTNKYILEVLVTDNGTPSLSTTVTCSVTILDVNDNVPTFSQSSYNFSITENVPLKTVVGLLEASDADAGKNSDLSFEFVSFWSGNSSHFLVNAKTGTITTNSNLDRESIKMYELWYRVVDGGTPKLSSDVNVTIHVNDVNDNYPVFSSTMYSGAVRENSAVGTTIITLTVTDLDVGVNADVTLSINTASTAGAKADSLLSVNPRTGEITVKATVDREVTSSFEFQVIAVDGGLPQHTSSTSVSIDVTDVNDNAPVFRPTFYNAEIAYTGRCDNDNSITTVIATDADIGRNAQLYFYLTESTYKHMFTINSAGVFSLLDIAQVNFKYVIGVGVVDNGIPVQSAITRATVRIDTFDPMKVITSFRLKISKATFQKTQTVFLEQLKAVIRHTYPDASVRLWCAEERSGTSRRRLLQSSAPVTVHVYAIADKITDVDSNIEKEKKILTSEETVTLLPNSAITGPTWERFGIESVREYHVTPTPWEKTTAGIATLAVIAIILIFLIALVVFLCCRWKRNKRNKNSRARDERNKKQKESHSQRKQDIYYVVERPMYLP